MLPSYRKTVSSPKRSTSNFKHSVRLVFSLTHGIPPLRDLRGRALSAALKASYIFDPRTYHKIWIWETLKVWSANSLDNSGLALLLNAAGPSIYQKLCLVYLTRYRPETRRTTSLFGVLFGVSKVPSLSVSCILMQNIKFCNFSSHSLLPNHHCKYRATSSWVKFDNCATFIHQKFLSSSNTDCWYCNRVSMSIVSVQIILRPNF